MSSQSSQHDSDCTCAFAGEKQYVAPGCPEHGEVRMGALEEALRDAVQSVTLSRIEIQTLLAITIGHGFGFQQECQNEQYRDAAAQVWIERELDRIFGPLPEGSERGA